MSAPHFDHEDAVNGAISELISAESALNMEPDPIPGTKGYLSQTDAWAKHAVEHIHAVFVLLLRVQSERNAMRDDLRRARTVTP